MNESFYCSTSSPAFVVLTVLDFGLSNSHKVVSHCFAIIFFIVIYFMYSQLPEMFYRTFILYFILLKKYFKLFIFKLHIYGSLTSPTQRYFHSFPRYKTTSSLAYIRNKQQEKGFEEEKCILQLETLSLAKLLRCSQYWLACFCQPIGFFLVNFIALFYVLVYS